MNYAAVNWFLAYPIFDPEDGGDTFHRKVGSHTNYELHGAIFQTMATFNVIKFGFPKAANFLTG
jgi:hypothetical protein